MKTSMNKENNSIGVGPHSLPWPEDARFDTELLKNGDSRNVEDKYRYWSVEAIKADLDASRNEFHIAIENWQHDMNIGTIVRNANAFNAAAVHVIGKRHWNRRGAMVTDRYMHVYHHKTVQDFVTTLRGFTVIAVDNYDNAESILHAEIPKKCVFVFGGEGPGLSDDLINVADKMVKIDQFGSTRSVNVGVASGIIMHEWVRRYVKNDIL